jgi:chemotaxis protein MotB
MAIEEDPPAGVPEWVVSFGDMMSLLLTFFIMLVSMSEMKKDDKFQAVVDSLREQFGDSMAAVMIQSGELRPPNGRVIKMTKTAKHQREQLMRGSKVSGPRGDFDHVEVIRAGKRSGVGVVVYFDDFTTELSDAAQEQLQQLNEEIAGKPQKIEIRGHASLRPLAAGEKYADHWELAYRRALATMDFMVKELAVDPQRIRITSAGANEPVASGVDSNGTPHNARVEVMVLEEVVSDLRVEDKDVSVAAGDGPEAAGKSASPKPIVNPEATKPSAPGAEKTKP